MSGHDHRVRRRLSAILLGMALMWSAPATADDQGHDDEARALFEAGRVAFSEGRFDSALSYFKQAYGLSPRPALLYNIGTAADRLRLDAEALGAFEEYLQKLPNAPNHKEVEARVEVLRRQMRPATAGPGAQPAPAPAGPAPQPVAAPTPASPAAPAPEATPAAPDDGGHAGDGSSVAPWVVIGVSGAALVTGGVLIAMALGDVSTVEDAGEGTRWADIRDAHDRAPTLSAVGIGLAVAGVAGVAIGAVWLAGSGEDEGAVALELVPTGVLVRGRL